MRGTRTVLISSLFALVLTADPNAPSAADDCLTKPNGPTPQGQHWYYRIDHANGGRQCWYLRTENGRGQKVSPKTEENPADAMAQITDTPRTPAAATKAESSLEKKGPVAVAPVPWLNVLKLPEPVSPIPAAPPAKPETVVQTADAAATAIPEKAASVAPVAAPSGATPNADSSSVTTRRTRELQRRQQAQVRTEPSAPAPVETDHTFALLMIILVALAIAGPAIHFAERRRRRKTINFRPPPLPRVVALNAPATQVRARPTPVAETVKHAAPTPVRPPDQTERLAHALQQVVDRLQTLDRPESKAARMRISPRSAGRASM